MMPNNKKNHGFTLVELSIVLVVIALLVAGITAGQKLVKQGKFRQVITEAHEYKSAIHAFQLKYSGLPGDIGNASSYWPSCDGTATNCNGNEDGKITRTTSSDSQLEYYRAWQQLSDSGLIPGSYTGIGYNTTYTGIAGTNVPKGPMAGSAYHLNYEGNFLATYRNLITLANTTSNNVPRSSALVPADAYAIDKKADDGLPNSGSVGAHWSSADGYGGDFCRDGSPGVYELTEKRVACRLGFEIQ